MFFYVYYFCNVVGFIVGLNLDLSYLIWMGVDLILLVRELGVVIYYVYGKDVCFERYLLGVNGVMEIKEVMDVVNRVWNYVVVGCG